MLISGIKVFCDVEGVFTSFLSYLETVTAALLDVGDSVFVFCL